MDTEKVNLPVNETEVAINPGDNSVTGEFESSHVIWLGIGVVHCLIAMGWWWLMPHGFPVESLRFWVNSVIPFAIVAYFCASFYAIKQQLFKSTISLMFVIPGFWFGVALSVTLYAPGTRRGFFVAIWFIAAVILYGARKIGPNKIAALLALILGFTTAGTMVVGQFGGEPTTQPITDRAIDFQANEIKLKAYSIIKSDSGELHARVANGGGSVATTIANIELKIVPRLAFRSRSPDRFWTNLAPRRFMQKERNMLVGSQVEEHANLADFKSVNLFYRGADRSSLHVSAPKLPVNGTEAHEAIYVDAYREVCAPIYSHLNSYCALELRTRHQLFVEFGNTGKKFPIETWQYPVGKPATFASWTGERLQVLTASSGEKGPFTVRASEPFKRGDVLKLTFYDENARLFTMEFLDWSRHASVDLSPTAGWGVKQNAVEFIRSGSNSMVWFTLAGTSVGRGFDSVGHAPGVYRNRIIIRPE